MRAVEFPVVGDSRTSELAAVLRRISHTSSEVEVFPEARCVEVSGDPQHEHMDRHDWSRLTRFPIEDIVDINGRFSSPAELQGSTRIIPTLSFVIYFNAVGGCEFPAAGQTITGKRGRIIMFQNYIDEQRPAHDTQATHFGFYGNCPSQFGADTPKRMMTGGLLRNQVPSTLLGANGSSLAANVKMPGIMYWGVCQGEHGGVREEDRCPGCGSIWCSRQCRGCIEKKAADGDKEAQVKVKKWKEEDARRKKQEEQHKEARAKAKAEAQRVARSEALKVTREAGVWNCMKCYNLCNTGETCGKCGKPPSGGGVAKPATKKVSAEDFAKFDADGDGFLDEDEVEHLLEYQLGRKLTGTELSDYFAQLDTDKDHKVSLDEYVASLVY